MKNKKLTWLWITLIALDVAITIFLFVIHIIMLAKTAGANLDKATIIANKDKGLIEYLQYNTTLYLWLFVVPLFVILAGNIVGLVLYVRKSTKKEQVKVDNLTDDQREALRRELLQELSNKQDTPNAEEDKKE